MKKLVSLGVVLSLIPGLLHAEHPRVTELVNQKQEKMDKLKKCKGTTESLKIAGLSTLGITAVGVVANVAEAIVLKDKTNDLTAAKAELEKKELEKKKREEEAKNKLKTGASHANSGKEDEEKAESKEDNAQTDTPDIADCEDYASELLAFARKKAKNASGEQCFTFGDIDLCKHDLMKNIPDSNNSAKTQEWLTKMDAECEKIKKENSKKGETGTKTTPGNTKFCTPEKPDCTFNDSYNSYESAIADVKSKFTQLNLPDINFPTNLPNDYKTKGIKCSETGNASNTWTIRLPNLTVQKGTTFDWSQVIIARNSTGHCSFKHYQGTTLNIDDTQKTAKCKAMNKNSWQIGDSSGFVECEATKCSCFDKGGSAPYKIFENTANCGTDCAKQCVLSKLNLVD